VGDGSDIARMGHQQQVMSAIVQRAKSTDVLVRPDRLYGFLDAVTASLTVDDDLDSLTALASLATTAAQVADDRISFQVMPWEPEPTDPNRVVPSAEAADVFQHIRTDAPLEDDEEDTSSDEAQGSAEAADPDGSGDTDTPETRDEGSDDGNAGTGARSSETVESAGDMCG
jgi:anionic cell wall polymer biosynthesis LytR-Cps2A-Psr (LCP) family protein